MDRFSRTELLLGADALLKLKKSKVIVFGVGGVGSYVCEALARCGVGTIAMVDSDTVSESNINRQLVALSSTVGMMKTHVMRDRIRDINPDCTVICHDIFYTAEKNIDISGYDFVVDAIDTVSAKIALAEEAEKLNIPIISSMGTGNKLDPLQFELTDIYKTSVCPLARVMRRELKARNIKGLRVLYSKEQPQKSSSDFPASVSFVPSVAGLIIASDVIKTLVKTD